LNSGPSLGQKEKSESRVHLSIVIPFYNEVENLQRLYQCLRSVLDNLNLTFQILFIDDGSTDNSVKVLTRSIGTDHAVEIIHFRKNCGKSEALAAGFEKALGHYVITMDADMQDDPAEIPRILNKLEEGYDLVSGWKKKRHDPLGKRIPSKIFNKVTSWITGVKLHDMNCGLKGYRKSVVDEIEIYGELHRFIPVLAKEQGFRLTEIEVQHHPRRFGKTKFGSWRFISGFLDLFTVIITTRFLARPLHFFGSAGLICFITGAGIGVGLIVWKYGFGNAIMPNPRAIMFLLLGIFLSLVGLLLFSIGLMCELMYRISRTERYFQKRMFQEKKGENPPPPTSLG
jgi:glycosyltransferase involved in cell wall biosynthesis